jgi:histone H3/H4
MEMGLEDSHASKSNASRKREEGLPHTSIKRIMRLNDGVTSIGGEAVVSTTRATELFIAYLAQKSAKKAVDDGRNVLEMRDLNSAIDNDEKLGFLRGAFGPPRDL